MNRRLSGSQLPGSLERRPVVIGTENGADYD